MYLHCDYSVDTDVCDKVQLGLLNRQAYAPTTSFFLNLSRRESQKPRVKRVAVQSYSQLHTKTRLFWVRWFVVREMDKRLSA